MQTRWLRFLSKYVFHPIRIISQNSGVLFIFFVVILVNYLTKNEDNSFTQSMFVSGWVFESLPGLIISVVLDWRAVVILIILYLIKSTLAVVVAEEMMLVYSRNRRNIIDTLRHISIRDVFWFLWAESAIYLVFFLIAMVFYVPLAFVWLTFHVDLSVVLYIVFLLFYPAFYISLSFTSMITVFPVSYNARFSKIKYLFKWQSALQLYFFYSLRLGLEGLLLLAVPIIALLIWNNQLIATISVAFGLLLPFALLRGSAYEVKLHILREDADTQNIFAKHYQENLLETKK